MKHLLNSLPRTRFTRPPTALTLLAVLLLGCKKETEEEKLPPATQEGRNHGGFLLDGQAWLPKASVTSSSTVSVRGSWSPRGILPGLSVVMVRVPESGNDETGMSLYIPRIRQPGTYQLNQSIDPVIIAGSRPAFGTYGIDRPSPRRTFYTGPDAPGTLVITRFDTVTRIAAGTFELTVREGATSETHRLTQGRFDVRF